MQKPPPVPIWNLAIRPLRRMKKGERLVGQYLQRRYTGVGKGQFNTMKCIDLFHGKEVTELVRKYAGRTK
jgi:Type VI secretion system (T6SS), amidase immunity protein